MKRENVLVRFDALSAGERDHATLRFEKYREDLKRIGYDHAGHDSDPMIRAAELATVAVALGGSWSEVFQCIDDQMLPADREDAATRGAAESLALMWMGASLDVPEG
jgi:hypothetical protein